MKDLSDVKSVNDFLKLASQPKKTSFRKYSGVIREVVSTIVAIYPPHVVQEIAIRLIHFLADCHKAAAETLEKEKMFDDAEFYRDQKDGLLKSMNQLDDVII